ncbi:MAG: hypothetical protein J6S49_02250 [Erysipelotrichaceae bacterium]|nr:hypothetical protein [Erysipelotrichaceae bacterium]
MGKRGRPKTAKNVIISPWLSAKADCREGRFCQIGNTLLLSEEFQTLKDSTKYLYICMAMEAAGRSEFVFPLSAAKKYGIARATLRRAIEELIDKQFIDMTSSGKTTREANFYVFSSKWKPP